MEEEKTGSTAARQEVPQEGGAILQGRWRGFRGGNDESGGPNL